MKYQLVILGPHSDRSAELLTDGLKVGIENLGLDPAEDYLDFLHAADADRIQWKGNPLGVWFGGHAAPDAHDIQVLRELMAREAPVLPLVEDTENFSSLVPHDPDLRPFNGRQWDEPSLVGDVLGLMRLTRTLRQAFISYRRIDSQRVAVQLFDGLSQRGYRPFLDTASVNAAMRFQEVLHGRLSDMDLVLFLDSSTALESQWVTDELTLANNLGLGVLQLVWPDKKPFSGAALSVLVQLEKADFVDQDFGPTGQLATQAVQTILAKAEEVRIESLGQRRRRVVGELLRRVANHVGLRVVAQPLGPIELRDSASDEVLAWALPLVGLPTDLSIRQEFTMLPRRWEDFGYELGKQGQIEHCQFQIVYDALGIERDSRVHLDWLNQFLPLKTLRIDRERNEAANPLEQWLIGL